VLGSIRLQPFAKSLLTPRKGNNKKEIETKVNRKSKKRERVEHQITLSVY
jgi:hypothetical protein